uniref:Pre T cell antigen receptor alpha n=1 Tax=Microcebus murinus TaxID=30608 RepID=A0A8C5XHP3_MICMU
MAGTWLLLLLALGCPALPTGEASTARTCPQEPLKGMPGQALRLGALRVLLFKLLLFDVLLTCSRLRACPPQSPASAAARLRALRPHRRRPAAVTEGREAAGSPSPLWALQPRDHRGDHTRPGRQPRSSVWQEGTFFTTRAWGWCSLGAFFCT